MTMIPIKATRSDVVHLRVLGNQRPLCRSGAKYWQRAPGATVTCPRCLGEAERRLATLGIERVTATQLRAEGREG